MPTDGDLNVRVINHPLLKTVITTLRAASTAPAEFRHCLHLAGLMLFYEVMSDCPVKTIGVWTPTEVLADGHLIDGDVILIQILRAADPMIDGPLHLLPQARVGHIDIKRDEKTAQPTVNSVKLPGFSKARGIYVLDPMLATGGSASAALGHIKEQGPDCSIHLLSIFAAPDGVRRINKDHPDVQITVAALDERLNDKFYIVPGCGDAGDRAFGT